jgi:hypothetical protein
MANVVGTISLNLFRKTPLNISSSEIGETKTLAIRFVVKNELNKFLEVTMFKIKSEKYNMPYDKNMFKITIKRIILIEFGENADRISSLAVEISPLSLKIK